MITKKTLKKIRKGNLSALTGAIEDLLDEYDSRPFDDGYNACLDDMYVHSSRLAEVIITEAEKKGDNDGRGYYLLDNDELEPIIENFFTELNKDYGRK